MSKGGKRDNQTGRPKGSKSKEPLRDVVKQVRWTSDEWVKVCARSAQKLLLPSEYIRRKSLDKAV